MIGRATLLLAALAALSLMAAPALAEHTAEHVQREQARLVEKEAEVQNGLITPEEACQQSGLYQQTHPEECFGAPPGSNAPSTSAAASPPGSFDPGIVEPPEDIPGAGGGQYNAPSTSPPAVLPETGGPPVLGASLGIVAIATGFVLGGVALRRLVRG